MAESFREKQKQKRRPHHVLRSKGLRSTGGDAFVLGGLDFPPLERTDLLTNVGLAFH
jgi:hypothetical protein